MWTGKQTTQHKFETSSMLGTERLVEEKVIWLRAENSRSTSSQRVALRRAVSL